MRLYRRAQSKLGYCKELKSSMRAMAAVAIAAVFDEKLAEIVHSKEKKFGAKNASIEHD